ncbi:IS5/IS1182 family transposase, partial [Kitasatospora aureofaciens]
HGHLVGGLLHSAGGRAEKDLLSQAPRRAADPTAWQNAFHRLARCFERRATVIDAFFDLADSILIIRSLVRRAWTTYRWQSRPRRRP